MAENGEQDPLMINSNEGQALEEDKKEETDGQARKKDVCHICFQHFRSEIQLNYHFAEVHEEVNCSHCDLTFPNKIVMQKHIEILRNRVDLHLRVKSCEICNKVFSTKDILFSHISSQHGMEKVNEIIKTLPKNERPTVKCSKCELYMWTEQGIKKHLEIVHESIPCVVCKKVFTTKDILFEHIRSQHGMDKVKEMIKKLPKEDRPSKKCSYCDSYCWTDQGMIKHLEKVHGNKTCVVCEKLFQTKDILFAHIRSEHGEDKVKEIIKKIPKEDRPTKKCLYCDSYCWTEQGMIDHLANVHEISACVICKKVFETKDTLFAHIRSEHGMEKVKEIIKMLPQEERPSKKCSKCEAYCWTEQGMIEHLTTVHDNSFRRIQQESNENDQNEVKIIDNTTVKEKDHNTITENVKNTGQVLWVFKCTICGSVFKEKQSMANHNKEKHGGSRFIHRDGSWKCAWIFKCTICSKELTSNPENHVRSAHDTWLHDQEDWNLNQGLIKNDEKRATKTHLEVNVGKQIESVHEGKKSERKRPRKQLLVDKEEVDFELKKIMEKDSEKQKKPVQEGESVWMYACTICAATFKRRHDMTKHNSANHEGKKFFYSNGIYKCTWVFQCAICNNPPTQFSSKPGITEHVKLVHKIEIIEPTASAEDEKNDETKKSETIPKDDLEKFNPLKESLFVFKCRICRVDFEGSNEKNEHGKNFHKGS